MINSKKNISFFAAAIFFTGCFFLCSCENDFNEVQQLSQKKIGKEVATDVESYLSQDAKVKAKLTSPLMERTETDTPLVEFPKTLHVDFYDDSMKIQSRLFAKYGKYLENQGKVFLRDSVIVFNVTGDTVRTEELWWDRDKEIFYTNKKVDIQEPTDHYVGLNGMTADQGFRKWTLNSVSGVANVPDSTLPAQ